MKPGTKVVVYREWPMFSKEQLFVGTVVRTDVKVGWLGQCIEVQTEDGKHHTVRDFQCEKVREEKE